TPLDFPVAATMLKNKFLSSGNVAYLFQRTDNKFEYVEVAFDGTIERRNEIAGITPNAWIVYEMSEVGDDLYIHGVTSKTAYTPDKPNGYQIMKVSPSKIDWISFTDEKEFKPTFVQIGDEKGKPYDGGILKVRGLHVGPTGNIF